MTTDSSRIIVAGLQVEVVRKAIKNVHLAVYPPNGRVRIAVPTRLSEDAVRLAVIGRLSWIRRRQRAFEGQPRETEREFVSGESHYVEGRRYRLRVVERDGPAAVRLRGGAALELTVSPKTSRAERAAVLERWYRARLRTLAATMFAKWEPIVGARPAHWGIRKMRTKWGSCLTQSGRIWINLELAKKPRACLEYIIVHELVHLLERCHNDRFRAHLDRCMPKWREVRDLLNSAPLAHDRWSY